MSKLQKLITEILSEKGYSEGILEGRRAAHLNIANLIKRRNKSLEGNWQHEDIDYLIEDLRKEIEL